MRFVYPRKSHFRRAGYLSSLAVSAEYEIPGHGLFRTHGSTLLGVFSKTQPEVPILSGAYVITDSAHERGERHMYVIDVSGIVLGGGR